jgi:HK97 family phage portal protein
MQHKPSSFRQRLAKAILGSKHKEFIPALDPIGDGVSFGGTGRLNDYATKLDQMQANIGWCFVANTAIADPCAAVEIKLYKKNKDGTRDEIKEHEILDLLDSPNAAHTGEQLMQLHYTYMNFVGESYIQMIRNGEPFIPEKGQLPHALQIFPAHKVQFTLGDTYSGSTVKLGGQEWPVLTFIRDLNPDPDELYRGRSIIAASAVTIDMEQRMKEWNREVFNNGAHPSLVFSTNEALSDEAYARWKEQFKDEHTGAENAHKPLLIEGGDAKPYMLSQKDLDFLESRKFSRDEILAMWRLSPGMIGSVENVNRANLEAGFYINAVVNIVPRVRQFIRQLNATFVSVYDPTLELDFVSPVPEDKEFKLKEVSEGVDKWWTKDEARQKYGDDDLPNGTGKQIIVNGASSMPLEDVLAGANLPLPAAAPVAPAGKALRAKQVSINDFPGLLDDVDMVPDDPGCIMLDTEALPVLKHVEGADDDLVDSTDMDHSPVPGEDVPHITLLYGLLENGNIWKDKVDTVLKDWKPGGITIAKVGAFDLGESYAIVAHIKKTPELVDGHERLTLLPHIQTYSEYLPHLTLAYVQHDQAVADKWVKALGKQYNGKTIKAKGINYGDQPAPEPKKSLTPVGVKKNS